MIYRYSNIINKHLDCVFSFVDDRKITKWLDNLGYCCYERYYDTDTDYDSDEPDYDFDPKPESNYNTNNVSKDETDSSLPDLLKLCIDNVKTVNKNNDDLNTNHFKVIKRLNKRESNKDS